MKFRASLFLLLLSTMINQSYAHKSDSIFYYLNEVTIDSKSREEILNLYLPNPIVNITSEQVLALQPVNMADLIESSGSLSLQKSQQGGGSPMIRGFEASRILLMIDHVRMNNLIYRSGHLQNLITTDHNTVRQIEVTYGPSSVAYGSDALGGTIHLFTKEPVLSDEDKLKHNAELLFQVNSANTGANVHVETMQAKKTWGTYASFSCQHFGDLRSGKRKNPFLKDDAYIRCDEYVESVNGTDQI
ncbi:MAG: TonB-dependent receptor plug domain-containing protein, partial [Bacteroidales bacterium]